MAITDHVVLEKIIHLEPDDIVVFRFNENMAMLRYLDKDQVVGYIDSVADGIAQMLPEGARFIVLPEGIEINTEKIRYGESV